MLKIISISLLSLGLASGALAQSRDGGSTGEQPGDPLNKVNPGAVHAPQATDDTTTHSVRTNCAPNMQTNKTSPNPDKTATTSVTAGEAGPNTSGQSSDC